MPYESKVSALGQMWMEIASPSFSFEDMKWYLKVASDMNGFLQLEKPVLDEAIAFDLNNLSKQYKVPVYYISGEADWQTPRVMVEDYYKKVEAPDKAMVVIKNAGHSPFIDQPEKFQEAVKSLLSRTK